MWIKCKQNEKSGKNMIKQAWKSAFKAEKEMFCTISKLAYEKDNNNLPTEHFNLGVLKIIHTLDFLIDRFYNKK